MACSTSPRFAASHSKAPLIAKICHSARNCAERQISIRHASLAHQPAVHDLPLVLTSWSKIQKRRSRLLQLKKEFKRIPGARRLGIDGLRLDPSVPLPDNQRLRVLLSHSTHARSNDELSARMATFGQMITKSFLLLGKMASNTSRSLAGFRMNSVC